MTADVACRRCGLHPVGTACGPAYRDPAPPPYSPLSPPGRDVCLPRRDGTCGRGDHPTVRSPCRTKETDRG